MNATISRLRAAGFEVWCSPDCGIVLVHGDALKVLPLLDTSEFAGVLADPPYGMSVDVDCSRFSGGSFKSQQKRGNGRCYDAPIVGDDKPFDPSPWLGFRRVLLWGCNHFASRLPVGTTLVWIKRQDEAFGSFLSDAELAWMKGGNGVYCRRDLSNNAIAKHRKHPTQKPVGLMLWCLDKLKSRPGDLILDPYMGVATVPVACIRTGRRCLAIEIEPQTPNSPDYFGIAVRRVEAELNRFPLLEPPPKRQKELI